MFGALGGLLFGIFPEIDGLNYGYGFAICIALVTFVIVMVTGLQDTPCRRALLMVCMLAAALGFFFAVVFFGDSLRKHSFEYHVSSELAGSGQRFLRGSELAPVMPIPSEDYDRIYSRNPERIFKDFQLTPWEHLYDVWTDESINIARRALLIHYSLVTFLLTLSIACGLELLTMKRPIITKNGSDPEETSPDGEASEPELIDEPAVAPADSEAE